jgi:hypothetical protein
VKYETGIPEVLVCQRFTYIAQTITGYPIMISNKNEDDNDDTEAAAAPIVAPVVTPPLKS